MRSSFFAGIALAATCGVAAAADLPRAPRRAAPLPPETSVYLGWTGFYIGLNAGGGIGNVDSAFSAVGAAPFASVNNSLPGAVGGGRPDSTGKRARRCLASRQISRRAGCEAD
jgi:hypothetical protein